MSAPQLSASPNPPPVATDAHDQRACIFKQTGSVLRYDTRTLGVLSSRGFDRELPPTTATRPALRARRYSIDVTHAYHERRWSYDGGNLEQHTPLLQSQIRLEQACVTVRETDEPLRRRPCLCLPDPLRHRDLHRWGNIVPPQDDDIYVDIGKASLTNDDFHSIVETTVPECWFRDNVLDIGLELTSLYYNGEANGIAIASSLTAQCVLSAADMTTDDDISGLREYRAMFEDKKFIFMPLNDGYGELSTTVTHGVHWALLLIDRPNSRAHYIDSLFKEHEGWQNLARTYAHAIGNLLEEEYEFYIEWNAPNQWKHNKSVVDRGPCGPFVLKMVNVLTRHIRDVQHMEREADILFHLSPFVQEMFKNEFDSEQLRWHLIYTLGSVKASQIASRLRNEHDEAALGDLRAKGLIDLPELPDPAPIFWDAPLFDKEALTIRRLECPEPYKPHRRPCSDSCTSSSENPSLSSLEGGEPSGTYEKLSHSPPAVDINLTDGELRDDPTSIEEDNEPGGVPVDVTAGSEMNAEQHSNILDFTQPLKFSDMSPDLVNKILEALNHPTPAIANEVDREDFHALNLQNGGGDFHE
ncbi:hypothetical protein N0V90_000074 [Kalmusia sp. IMI 367209]|nr:hypothetical protein N0V90_000074 [Kalmusia sp. IMI 367209]